LLDLNKLYAQITALGAYQQSRRQDLATALDVAEKRIDIVNDNTGAFRDKLQKFDDSGASWLVAVPTSEEPFETHAPVECPKSYTIVSTDGSQIEPDRHGPHSAFLINIGRVEIGYGDFLNYKFGSDPSLFFEEKDVVRRFGGEERAVSGAMLAALRQKMEAETLSKMIDGCANKPAVALVDGTLILWNLEASPEHLRELGTADLKQQSFISFMQLLSTGKQEDIPVAGYISSPGSNDVINALKVSMCPGEPVRCKGKDCQYTGIDFNEEPPCAKINGVTDAELFRRLLKDGERSSLFKSRSEILKAYGEERVFFFYLKINREIARIELPGWVARSKEATGLVHAVCLSQAEKGMGYPIAIAEAHEQAVVKSADRDMFNRLVSRELIKQGTPVMESRKAVRKRGGLI